MSVRQWCAVLLCLSLAFAGEATAGKAVLPASGRSALTKVPAAPDVIVNGLLDRKRGTWKRAEADHVIVISQDSVSELTRVTRNLERLYALMARLYRRGDMSDGTVKLQVVLFDSPTSFRAMQLRNLRSEQGPYLPAFADPTYYDPREDGPLLAIARGERIVDLNTVRAFNLDCDDYQRTADTADGLPSCMAVVPWHAPAVMTWEQMLYSRFAQHFILTYCPAAYPRWYLDGIGALFSTIEFRGDGAIDYARPLSPFLQVFRSYGDLNVADVLTGRYLDSAPGKAAWTPYHAWLLAHYFLFSNPRPERSRQFRSYMTGISRGVPMAQAAKVFGDMLTLQREIVRYGEGDTFYAHAASREITVAAPLVTALPPGSAALIEAEIELDTRLAPSANNQAASGAATPSEGQRAAWLAQARGAVELRHDPEAILFAAEAECRSGHPAACLADAEQVLSRSPDDVRALAWQGAALTDQTIAGPTADRAGMLAAARKILERAIALDDHAPLPRIAYFQSFTKAGERVPEKAMLGMAEVIRRVPAAPSPRLYLGEELVRQGKIDLARRLLDTVLHGAYDSPEKKTAEALFADRGGAAAAPPEPIALR